MVEFSVLDDFIIIFVIVSMLASACTIYSTSARKLNNLAIGGIFKM
jgi:hypothetical protein